MPFVNSNDSYYFCVIMRDAFFTSGFFPMKIFILIFIFFVSLSLKSNIRKRTDKDLGKDVSEQGRPSFLI